jgi:hypothetical protein
MAFTKDGALAVSWEDGSSAARVSLFTVRGR